MSKHKRFHVRNLNQLQEEAKHLGITIPVEEDISILLESIKVGSKTVPNRFLIHPLEGFDADYNGTPQDLGFRRYRRFAAGGAGTIWFEATAVVPEGRSNPRQFWIHDKNVDEYKRLVEETRKAAHESMGTSHDPLLILQITHSGRYSKPTGKPAPIIAHHSKILDPLHKLPDDYPLISDDELDKLQDIYVNAAKMAAEAGFEGVDIKSCHRYLISELHASFTRDNSKYGGSFENRIRFLTEIAKRIRNEVKGIFVTVRLNVYDAISYPYGFGVDKLDYKKSDLSEPIQLISILKEMGMPILNASIGNPYYNPHFGRPFDFTIKGGNIPDIHPLEGVALFIKIIQEIQQAHSDIPVIGSGYSWLRYFLPQVGAAVLKKGWASIIGLGRGALAYPDFVRDLIETKKMDPYKCCVSCSSCTQIMRDGGRTGCVIHDKEIYGVNYRLGRRFSPDRLIEEAERCRDCETPFCKKECPANINIPGFIKAFADGDIEKSYKILTEKNALPEICAYVCPTEVQCEGGCVENILAENAVAIQDIQRTVAQQARKKGLTQIKLPETSTGKKVAVVGAGPGGLACTIALLRKGHIVTIFDTESQAGGVVRRLIPSVRIPYDTTDQEYQAILENIPNDRLERKFNTTLTSDKNLDTLTAEYDAVFLGMGLSEGKTLSNKSYDNLINAVQFLDEAKHKGNIKVPKTVAVIGGGNTGMDTAITVKKNGARDVYMICFESFKTMPAWLSERQQALIEDIHFMNMFMPKGYIENNNKITSVKVTQVQLDDPDENGFCAPIEIPGSDLEIKVDMVIEALGQKTPGNLKEILPGVKLTDNNLILVGPDNKATSRQGIFAGGDIVNGGLTAVRAVADGLAAADEIDDFLKNN
jgi:NADPH-dependent glutamate synthase beta subunit-like oxidoreductase/2,4-dienoyl-CoA reductase-like NADH-dependent reductase (Old Yellow Enzyme family)